MSRLLTGGPLAGQQPEEQVVGPFALHVGVFAEMSLELESGPFQQPGGRQIAGITLGDHPMQPAIGQCSSAGALGSERWRRTVAAMPLATMSAMPIQLVASILSPNSSTL